MIIWLASYPRSGNTYLRVVLKHAFGLETYSEYDDKHDIGDDPATAKVVGHKERPGDFSLDRARESESVFLIKTHELVSNDLDKVIYILRDGRAAVVSYFHYLNTYFPRKYSLNDVLVGAVPYGEWGKHLESWNPENRKNTLVLKFEDLTSSPNPSVEKISDFLHMGRRQSNIPGFEELHSINPSFFRKGNADSWQEELHGEELYAFWLLNFPQMSRYYPIVNPPSNSESSELSALENYFLQSGSAIRT